MSMQLACTRLRKWYSMQVWDVGGSKNSDQLQRLVTDPAKVIANSRFLGRVEVPLSETLSLRRGDFLPIGCFPSHQLYKRNAFPCGTVSHCFLSRLLARQYIACHQVTIGYFM